MRKVPGWIPLVLVILLAVALYGWAGATEFPKSGVREAVQSIAVSLVVAVFCVIFLGHASASPGDITEALHSLNSRFDDLAAHIAPADDTRGVASKHFLRVERNRDMGEQYWVDLIDRLGSDSEVCWFAGTKMKLWLESPTFRQPLEKKLRARLRKGLRANDQDSYKTIIILSDPEGVATWRGFCESIISSVIPKGAPKHPESLGDRMKRADGLLRVVHTAKTLTYSLVLCAGRLAVTTYIGGPSRFQESPTMDIRPDSSVKQLYLDDLHRLVSAPPLASERGTSQP